MDDAGYADPDLGHAESGVVRGNPEVAASCHFEAAAEAPAGHPRDGGSRKCPHRFAEVAPTGDELFGGSLIELCHLLDIGAADHALLACAGEDQPANLGVLCEDLQALANGVDNGRSQNIERTGVADRQTDDAARVAIDAAMRIEHLHEKSRDR